MANLKLMYEKNEMEDTKNIVNIHDNEHDEGTGVMIHVVPENKGGWTHIEDLDSFFTRMYQYYVKAGFMTMVISDCLQLARYCFVVFYLTFLTYCVNYPILFREDPNNPIIKARNVTFSDIVYPQCVQRISFWWWALIVICGIIGFIRLIKLIYNIYHAYDIKLFYNNALRIKDADLGWISWSTVLSRVIDAQLELQMCIHKQQITELDIYQRILRFNNYLIAMVNKKLLPLHFSVPFVGDIPFLSKGLKYNLELLLFSGPWSPWQNCWHLRDCYKDVSKRYILARQLQNHITVLALLNLLLAPLIQTWQILYFFFSYAELIKRSPGSLSLRTWSLYARISLRHFNELDHELSDRLYRAYKPATKYLAGFPSPIATVIAKNITFISTSVLSVLIVLSVYDEVVLTVVHMITVITILGVIVATARACIPEEGSGQRSSEELLVQVLGHIHYLPPSWKGKAHTKLVATHFQKLFQYRAIYLIMELISPIVCPLVLLSLRTRALDIVDFYRNFTLSVLGIGDVCSFAQMDINRNGNPDWTVKKGSEEQPNVTQYDQGEDGKIELSLIAFSCRNPAWRVQEPSQRQFLHKLRNGVTNATNNYLSGNYTSFNMNKTMLDSYYNHNYASGQFSFPTENSCHQRSHKFGSVINEEEGEDRVENERKSEIIPDKVENSLNEEYDMSISMLHLYDLHLAKVATRSAYHRSVNVSFAEGTFPSTAPSTSDLRPQAQLSPNSSENTPLLRKNVP
ncbi:autophagy-related protein 9A-like [Arctopsyche grandis]|uniref:autophagy-related protein 9A-like n=1 Tax=Arctopsyche grandis TaxID=121162 RepID=UPI00406DA1A4